jgi:hypothetical protein
MGKDEGKASGKRSTSKSKEKTGNISASSSSKKSCTIIEDGNDEEETSNAKSIHENFSSAKKQKSERKSSSGSKGKLKSSKTVTDANHGKAATKSHSLENKDDANSEKGRAERSRKSGLNTSGEKLEPKRDNSENKVSMKTLAKLSAFSFNGSSSGDSSANASGIQEEHDRSACDPELKEKQCEVQFPTVNVQTPLTVQPRTKISSKNVEKLTVGEGCEKGRHAEFEICEENNAQDTNRLGNSGNQPVSTDSKAQPTNPFFQLLDDSDEDIMDDSFFSASSKKRKCFQLSDDLENKKVKQAPDDKLAPKKGQTGKNGGIGNQLPEAKARDRCQSPSILLHSQHSLTLSQKAGQGQVKEQGMDEAKLLPSIGGTPSHSQDKMSGAFFSSTPVPKSASENDNTSSTSHLSHSTRPNATDSHTSALKPTVDASSSGITDAVSTPVVTTTDKRPASSGKTTPSWLLKLNSNSQNRSKPVSAASSSSSSSSLFMGGGGVCDDLDLDLDLDFDQPFKKQRKS